MNWSAVESHETIIYWAFQLTAIWLLSYGKQDWCIFNDVLHNESNELRMMSS